jgi:hypothetical protein
MSKPLKIAVAGPLLAFAAFAVKIGTNSQPQISVRVVDINSRSVDNVATDEIGLAARKGIQSALRLEVIVIK